MKTINFDIMKHKDGNYIIESVNGQEVKINNITFGMYQNTEKEYNKNQKWFIIDFKIGLYIASGRTQKEAINNAKDIFQSYLNKTCEHFYTEMREQFEQLKIDNDLYYYVVVSTNKVNSQEESIYMTYKEADSYKSRLIFNHSNIYIDKRPKQIAITT